MRTNNKIKYTRGELIKWKRSKLTNPHTNRKIKKDGKIYNKLEECYLDIYPLNLDPLDSVDDKDPISLTIFWTFNKSKKNLIYSNPENLIIYKDDRDLCRCFERSSLEHLKSHKITKHPITDEKIPDKIMDSVDIIDISSNKSIEDKALEVFQLFTKISIFIDYTNFINLDLIQLQKLYYEIKDFYTKNISNTDREKINSDNNALIFSIDISDFNAMDKEDAQGFLLMNIKLLLEYENTTLKYMINYIILGGLSLVIPEIKDNYPSYSFSFDT